MKKLILSISFCYHDSSVTFSTEKEILLHIEIEKFYNQKHKRFKTLSEVDEVVSQGLKELGLSIDDVNEVLVTKWNNLYESSNVTILGRKFNAILTGHHENHIGTSIPSNYKKCVILCSDGGSEDGYTKLYYKKGKKIWLMENWDEKECTGKFYGTIAQMIIEPKSSKAHTSGVGKLMGLSSYGKYDKKIEKLIKENIEEINSLHFDNVDNLLKKFNLDNNYENVWLDKYKVDIAKTAHSFWVNKCAEYLRKHSKFSRNICLVGGCALNISLNSKLIEDKIFDNVYVSPISTDSGQSLGAILYRYQNIKCNYPYLGRGFESNHLYDEEVIEDLLSGKIVCWYQGRAEIGARALGHRSFLGIPNSMEMKKKISENIKGREPYRPVACIIPRKFVSEYFKQNYSSPYMTFCSTAKAKTKKEAPAIVHIDNTTRVQTIEREDNPVLYDILLKIGEKTGTPILMNTSLNVMGDAIVDSEEYAIETYKKSGADSLYINGIKYKEEKLISVLIPTYNNDDHLIDLLNSMKKTKILSDKNVEVIVIQNHNSVEIFQKTKQLEEKYKIRVYHQPKQGKSAALNYGIKKSSGKYIVSTDDDVIIQDGKWLYKFLEEFKNNPKLGYVSGKVTMYNETSNDASKLWEKKGGLSKGEEIKYWSIKFLNKFKYKFFPWPMHKICAGANQMIKKDILLEVGGYSEFLGTKGNVDGLTLEVGYKIAHAGYELLYNPNIIVYHKHPTDNDDIKKKLYYYGMQDTGVAMYIFLKYHDYRNLWWSIIGHELYTIKKMIKSIFKKYPLSTGYLIYGLKGNMKGWRVCLKNYRKEIKNGNHI